VESPCSNGVSFVLSVHWKFQWKDDHCWNSIDIVVMTKFYLGFHSHYYHPLPQCLKLTFTASSETVSTISSCWISVVFVKVHIFIKKKNILLIVLREIQLSTRSDYHNWNTCVSFCIQNFQQWSALPPNIFTALSPHPQQTTNMWHKSAGQISGSHSGEYEDDCLMGCCTM
jgi:hypothetical protein